MFHYQEAIPWAREILRKNPRFVLAGSLALILQKSIDRKTIGDLDFVTTKDHFTPDFNSSTEEIYKQLDQEGYACYKVQEKRGKYYYNVFVYEDRSLVDYHFLDNGIPVQDATQILGYKKKWGRPKDLLDLEDGIVND